LAPAIRSAWPRRHSLPGPRHPTVRPAANAPPPPSCVGPNSASVLHRRPRGRLRQLWGSAPAPPRASALHQSSFRNLRLRFNYRSQMSQLTVTHPTDCLLAQIFQSTACNATHSIEQRAAKWMLAALDRIGIDEVSLTQEQLGGLLGVGRSYVSRVMRKLREDGVLKTRRGRVLIVRRAELEARSCDCNALVRDHFEEVLRGVYPTNGDENGSDIRKAHAS